MPDFSRLGDDSMTIAFEIFDNARKQVDRFVRFADSSSGHYRRDDRFTHTRLPLGK
jgi:hypothetical protein